MSTIVRDKEIPFEDSGNRYVCTPAVTGRASCKGKCKEPISQGQLRFGSSSNKSDMTGFHWRCLSCVTAKQVSLARGE
jgi:hypothetical protein